ncbi:MAG: NAD(P)-dependent glycerol-1-phosphate dehydrogenase [Thermoplasmata archaeon]
MVFDKKSIMKFPSVLLVGHDVLKNIPEICNELGMPKEAIIITGKTTYGYAGNKVEMFLKKKGFNVKVFFAESATLESIAEIERKIKTSKVPSPFLLGIGGGSKIDIAKIVSYNLQRPFISVPTIASHDGIASPRASLKNGKLPISIEAKVPVAIIADTHVIVKSPYRFLASGCADVISNLTAVKDWELAHKANNEHFSSTASTLSKYTAENIIENAKEISKGYEKSVWTAIKPILMSGISMSIAGSSRPASGSEHLFSHALDVIGTSKALHGEQCGVGTIMMMYLHNGDWEKIRNALKTLKCPTTAKELGISENDLIKAIVLSTKIRKDRYTILNEVKITKKEAYKIAKVTKVI